MHNKLLARLLMITTFIFLSTGAYLLLPDKPKVEIPKPIQQNISWSNVATNTIVTDNKSVTTPIATSTKSIEVKISEPTQVKAETTTSSEIIKNEELKYSLSATIIISDTQYPLVLPEKSTAYDAMQALVSNKQISVLMKEFGGIGYFVEEINGLKNNNQTGEYWIYYINDISAKVGISAYTLKQNDKITWKYEKSKF
ncbi:MAG: hypothetical protein ACD_72C00006G0001 [uncultured bacterium]|nr:MAG: hypothetical protein ACD_72C00006G0001 [uncultured bacterium]